MGSTNYIDIDWPDLFKPIPGLRTDKFNRIRINREVIPIIFVPGIMGSRLKNKKTGVSVWDPDREIMCMLKKYGGWWNTPAQRKRMLIGEAFDPEYLAVDEKNQKHNEGITTFLDPWRVDRGWGGIYWGSYGKFLQELHTHNWEVPLNPTRDGNKKEIVGKCFEFPVWAFGYNWTDSNLNSGKKLALKIKEIKGWYRSKGRLCKYVILISHSMGGLVCRSACMLHQAERDVLGVIHGVQPTTGAAAAYWRMKAGFERVGESVGSRLKSTTSAWVLGTSGEEVTCIMGNSPGGLELLPNQNYTDNDGKHGWLHITQHEGTDVVLPRDGDPYNEIYKVRGNHYWRLINEEWLDPKDGLSRLRSIFRKDPWDEYYKCVSKAEYFHQQLHLLSHDNTYQLYSSNISTADQISFSRRKLPFMQHRNSRGVEAREPSIKTSARGSCVMYVEGNDEIGPPLPDTTHVLTMSPYENYPCKGDGTVPASSSRALKTALHSCRLESVEHQEAFEAAITIGYAIKAVNNLALKRIREGEVASAI